MSTTLPTKCPICGSKSFKDGNGFSSNTYEGKAYLIPALEHFKKNAKEFIKNNSIYKCDLCHSYWIYPWFTKDQSKVLFDSVKSNHQAGWDQFEFYLKKKDPNYYMKWIAENVEKLNCKNFKYDNYAELGCPFSGFALSMGFDSCRESVLDALFRSKEKGSLWLQIDHFLNQISKFAFSAISISRLKQKNEHYSQLIQAKVGARVVFVWTELVLEQPWIVDFSMKL